ncbi:MAG: ATP-binding cassette domain-containing protein [bacterium JZ-2024 1]
MIQDLLEVKGVSFWRHYGDPFALRAVSFSVKAQETVCLFGAPGSGIRRVLPVLFGLNRPTSGVIRYMGIEGIDPDRRRLIRFIPSLDPCAPIFQVKEYVQWVSLLHRVPYSRQRAQALLSHLALTRRKNWLIRRLPLDEVACLRWGAHLAGNPLLVITQNPSKSLSDKALEILRGWIQETHERGGGFLFIDDQIEHLRLEEKLDPVCYFFYNGKVVLEGTLRDLKAPFRMVTLEAEDITTRDLAGISAWSVYESDVRVVVQTDLSSRESARKAILEAQGRIVIEEVTEKPLYQWLGF